MAYFRNVFRDVPLAVKAFHGDDGGQSVTPDLDIAVCTIERANVILSRLLEEGREDMLGMCVVDEVHMMCTDDKRGYLLEVLLTKLMFCLPEVQIVGMSATLPDLPELGTWLGASVYCTEFRPVELGVTVLRDGVFYSKRQPGSAGAVAAGEGTFAALLEPADRPPLMRASLPRASAQPNSPPPPMLPRSNPVASSLSSSSSSFAPTPLTSDESTLLLCLETLRLGKSVIVFCPTKQACITVAQYLSEHVAMATHSPSKPNDLPLAARRAVVLAELRASPAPLCSVLKAAIMAGVAYHHAGLSVSERNVIQLAFASGELSVLCATTTLAIGVNLPAHRVVIRSLKTGTEQLNVSTFRQMCGRAGRLGFDTSGEAVVLVGASQDEERRVTALMTAEQPPLRSCLHEAAGGGLERLILEHCLYTCRREGARAFVPGSAPGVDGMDSSFHGASDEMHPEAPPCGQNECDSDPGPAAKTSTRIGCPMSTCSALCARTLLFRQVPAQTGHELLIKTLGFLTACEFLTSSHVGAGAGAGVRDTSAATAGMRGGATSSGNTSGGSGVVLYPTPLARATVLSGLSPREAVDILRPLRAANEKLFVKSPLHLIFLVTPPEWHGRNGLSVPWVDYARIYESFVHNCASDTEAVAAHVGIDRGRLMRYTHSPPGKLDTSASTMQYRRFFHALVLLGIVTEWPGVAGIIDRYLADHRGALQSLQEQASYFCRQTAIFCQELNWTYLAAALGTISTRLNYGVREELLPLVRLGRDMSGTRAREFYKRHLRCPEDLVSAGWVRVKEVLDQMIPYDSRGGVRGAGQGRGQGGGQGGALRNGGHRSVRFQDGASSEPDGSIRALSLEHIAKRIVQRAAAFLREETALDEEINAAKLAAAVLEEEGDGRMDVLEGGDEDDGGWEEL